MFSKAKDKNANESNVQNAQADALADVQAQAQNNSKRKDTPRPNPGVPSIISSDVVMTGNINASGEVQFDGTIDGDIKAAMLIVGEHASVRGEIICERVTVRGRVEGGIRAKQVSLASSAHIMGDIVHSALAVENGAHFEGACRHSDDPLSDAGATDFRKARPTAQIPSETKTNAAAAPAANNAPVNGSDAPSFLSTARSPLR